MLEWVSVRPYLLRQRKLERKVVGGGQPMNGEEFPCRN